MFWWGHHRAFNGVRHVDGKLTALNIGFLAFVSLMPFASALTGEYARAVTSQVFYASTMFGVSVFAQLLALHLSPPGTLCTSDERRGVGRRPCAYFLAHGLCILSVAVAIALPGAGNMVFSLMGFFRARWPQSRSACQRKAPKSDPLRMKNIHPSALTVSSATIFPSAFWKNRLADLRHGHEQRSREAVHGQPALSFF